MNTEDLEKLKKKLPRGYRQMLIERTGYSLPAIDSVLRGDYMNERILDAAIKLAQEHQEKLKNYSEKINSI